MSKIPIMLITGTSRGIGKYLSRYYVQKGFQVIGCSRHPSTYRHKKYKHFCLDICDEKKVKSMLGEISRTYGRLDVLINNAGVASMNHVLLTPLETFKKILDINVVGTFLCCREAAKLMKKNQFGRIINFSTVAVPLKVGGEAAYVASKAAVVSLTQVLAKELADFSIMVNGIGPTPIKTNLIKNVPQKKIDKLIQQQSIPRYGKDSDISHVIDFFISPGSDFITGQIIYLGGVS